MVIAAGLFLRFTRCVYAYGGERDAVGLVSFCVMRTKVGKYVMKTDIFRMVVSYLQLCETIVMNFYICAIIYYTTSHVTLITHTNVFFLYVKFRQRI